MSIASEITRLQGVKSDILTAIADKGVTVPAGSALDDCPDLIASISSGGGGVNAGKEYITYSNNPVIITDDYIQCSKNAGQTAGDGQRLGVCPNYSNDLTWNELNINDEIEINGIFNIIRYGSGRTDLFTRCGLYNSQNTDRYKFEINNYDGTGWFYIFGDLRGSQFAFNFNVDVNLNMVIRKTSSDKVNFSCSYQSQLKYNSELTIPSSIINDSCLPAFGDVAQNTGLIYNNKLLKGSYIRINDVFLFGEPL